MKTEKISPKDCFVSIVGDGFGFLGQSNAQSFFHYCHPKNTVFHFHIFSLVSFHIFLLTLVMVPLPFGWYIRFSVLFSEHFAYFSALCICIRRNSNSNINIVTSCHHWGDEERKKQQTHHGNWFVSVAEFVEK